jgi:anti-sigma factor RsiW
MNITRDVINDLLTVYLAGEASPDTRAIVDEWLRTDPELARQAAEAGRGELPPVRLPEPTAERRALSRTRRWLRWRMILLGVAIYVTTLPLTVVFNSHGFRGLLIEDWPERIAVMTLAAALWIAFIAVTRGVRASGL